MFVSFVGDLLFDFIILTFIIKKGKFVLNLFLEVNCKKGLKSSHFASIIKRYFIPISLLCPAFIV